MRFYNTDSTNWYQWNIRFYFPVWFNYWEWFKLYWNWNYFAKRRDWIIFETQDRNSNWGRNDWWFVFKARSFNKWKDTWDDD